MLESGLWSKVWLGTIAAVLALGVFAGGSAARGRDSAPSFPAPDCPAQLRAGVALTSSLLSDATHTMKRYEAGGDTNGGEISCNYYDPATNYNYNWTLYYLFKTDSAAQVAQELAGGYAPLGGWAHPAASYCGVSKTAYAYVECSPSSDPGTLAGAKAMLAAAESMAAPQGSATTTTTNPKPAAPAIRAKVGKITGEAEFSIDGGKTFTALSSGTVLKNGDYVATGLRSRVTLDFGYDTLTVFQITQFRIDEYTNKANIAKTKMHLRVGSIKVIERHTNAIRSDFSVITPTCSSSVRDTGAVVSVAKNGTTSVFTTADVSYVKGLADTATITVRAGYMTTVGPNKKATKPVKFTAATLKKVTG